MWLEKVCSFLTCIDAVYYRVVKRRRELYFLAKQVQTNEILALDNADDHKKYHESEKPKKTIN